MITHRHWFVGGIEMVLVGGAAAAAAYATGHVISTVVNGSIAAGT